MTHKTKLLLTSLFFSAFGFSQSNYSVKVPEKTNEITYGHLNLGGNNPAGVPIEFNSYYMSVGDKPFIPIMGEMHFSRFPETYWEEQILKMKSGGINVIATYIFWNIHETEEGQFDWSGDKNIRHFLELCKKHNMLTLVRIGPFCHGEIRNGGIPDWMYGRPFEIRTDDPGYLFYVKRLYKNISQQLAGFYYKDGGPIMGIQLENELQHSAAPWSFTHIGQPKEMTVANYDNQITQIGVSSQDSKTSYADFGTNHLATLKKIALEYGIEVPLYTVTGWGRAAVLENEAIPVTAAYPYPFWSKPHLSPFFLFKDIQRNPDYSPVRYDGSKYPSFCAEMGVGIQITYARRPRVAPEASEALMLRTLGSGANGIGYYMYHGGLTPTRKDGGFFSDEAMGVPKISYDFQAPIGEYGKTKDSYNYLRVIHLFSSNFADLLAPMGVVLPETNQNIKKEDKETLRYSLRSDGKSGFVFLNNFQDHDVRNDQNIKSLNIELENERIVLPEFTLKKDASAILPFNLKIGTGVLKYAMVQPLAITNTKGKTHYIFFAREGFKPEFAFSKSSVKKISGKQTSKNDIIYKNVVPGYNSSFTITDNDNNEIVVSTLTREQALNFNSIDNGFCITKADLLEDNNMLTLLDTTTMYSVALPCDIKPDFKNHKVSSKKYDYFTEYTLSLPKADIEYEVKQGSSNQRFTFDMKKNQFNENISDLILDINYVGDNAMAFIDGKMINDNFYYGENWQIGLKRYADDIDEKGIYFYFRPIYKDASYLIDFEKDKVPEFTSKNLCSVNYIKVIPEYKISFTIKR